MPMSAKPDAKHQLSGEKNKILKLINSNRLPEARQACLRLSKKRRNDIDVELLMANISAKEGNLSAVLEHCERALTQDARCVPALFNMAVAAQHLGQTKKAVSAYRAVLNVEPTSQVALSSLGALLAENGVGDEAAALLEKAVKVQPQDYVSWFRLGQVRVSLSQGVAAQAAFRQAMALKPDFYECQYALANLLSAMAEYDEAFALYDGLRKVDPENPSLTAAVGLLYEFKGDNETAASTIEEGLKRHPDNLELAVVWAGCVKGRAREQAVSLLKRSLGVGCHSKDQRRDAYYALGRLNDRLQHYPEAFEHYRRANELEGGSVDMVPIEREFAQLKAGFPAPAVGGGAYTGSLSQRPVFIVGMPRSGTTLVEQILAAHSGVFAAGELDEMGLVFSRLRRHCGGVEFSRCLATCEAGFLESLAQSYLGKLDSLNTDADRVVDKMPHNFLALGLIAMLFPRARVIHCMRDPRDTCLSIFSHHFTANHPYASDLYALGRYYRLYQGLMAYWKRELALDILDVEYEKVVTDTEASARRLIEFCGLEWQPECLDFYDSNRAVTTPTYNDVRTPIYTHALNRWANYSDYLGELFSGLDGQLADTK